jgi:hypothetical protein
MTGSHSQRAWYDCDCQASQSQLCGSDWLVRPPDYRVSDYGYGRLQSTGSKCRKKCFKHPLTTSLFSPLSPLHYIGDDVMAHRLGIANSANRGQRRRTGRRTGMQHWALGGMTIVRTANSQSQLHYDCDWLASYSQRHGYDLNGQSEGHA